jgi:hypothetical protein
MVLRLVVLREQQVQQPLDLLQLVEERHRQGQLEVAVLPLLCLLQLVLLSTETGNQLG